jgi:hypothetical protein
MGVRGVGKGGVPVVVAVGEVERLGEGAVERGDEWGDQARERHERCEIGQREGEDGGAGGDERALHMRDADGDAGGVELGGADLGRGESADGEVGVEQVGGGGGCEALGEALRPTAITAGVVGIVDAFGGTVAEGDVAGEGFGRDGGHVTLDRTLVCSLSVLRETMV